MTAGCVEAEQGVERAHYLPSYQGFWLMQPNRPQPCWQNSYLHAQCLVLPALPPSPEGPGTKVALVIGGRRARRTGTLLSASTLPGSSHRLPHGWELPWAHGRVPAAGDSPCGRTANPKLGVYGEQALF